MPTASSHPRASAPSPPGPSPFPQWPPHAVPRWVLRLTVMTTPRTVDTVERHRVAEPRGDRHWEPAPPLPSRPSTHRARSRAPWAPPEAGAATCWARCASPPVRHLTMQAAELLLLPTHAALPEPEITVLPPYRRARRAALPASALPFLLRGWLAGTPPAAPAPRPSLYLLRTRGAAANAARPAGHAPDGEADGARWEAFGTILRERGDALLVTLPPGRTGTPGPTQS